MGGQKAVESPMVSAQTATKGDAMPLYAALLYYPEDQYWMRLDQADTSPGYGRFQAAATSAGVLRGGEALHPTDMATTITVAGGEGGDVVVTDGPYAEAK